MRVKCPYSPNLFDLIALGAGLYDLVVQFSLSFYYFPSLKSIYSPQHRSGNKK
jgi:hypothetical protein